MCFILQVEKEDYVLKAHVRSEKKELLEKLSDLPLLVSLKLSSPISMDYYTSFAQASVFGKKCSNGLSVAKGNNTQIFIAPITTSEKHLKAITQGQYLEGTLTLPKVNKALVVLPTMSLPNFTVISGRVR
jgi:tripeptidyl-peptidase-2